MTMFAGLSQLGQSMSSQAASADQSQSSTISSNTAGSPLIGIPAGGSGNNTTSGTFQVTNDVGTIYVQPLAPVGDMLTLIKTAEGEFVLNGTGNTLKLLMDYFLQSPEMWLRLAALSSKEEG